MYRRDFLDVRGFVRLLKARNDLQEYEAEDNGGQHQCDSGVHQDRMHPMPDALVFLQVVRKDGERLLKDSTFFTRSDGVHEELVERAGLFGERGGQALSLLDVFRNLSDLPPYRRIARSLGQDLQRSQQWQSNVEQRRQLPAEQSQISDIDVTHQCRQVL